METTKEALRAKALFEREKRIVFECPIVSLSPLVYFTSGAAALRFSPFSPNSFQLDPEILSGMRSEIQSSAKINGLCNYR